MSVIVTRHAEKRLKERMGLSKKSCKRATETAYYKGLRHKETVGNLNKWVTSLYFTNRVANNIRIYGDKAWIFAGRTLLTVLQVPNSLKKSVDEAFDNKRIEEERIARLIEAKAAFLSGEWVDSDTVQELTKMNFNECFSKFDFNRTASWWSIVGKTEEERQRNGQCILCQFKLKEGQTWEITVDGEEQEDEADE